MQASKIIFMKINFVKGIMPSNVNTRKFKW